MRARFAGLFFLMLPVFLMGFSPVSAEQMSGTTLVFHDYPKFTPKNSWATEFLSQLQKEFDIEFYQPINDLMLQYYTNFPQPPDNLPALALVFTYVELQRHRRFYNDGLLARVQVSGVAGFGGRQRSVETFLDLKFVNGHLAPDFLRELNIFVKLDLKRAAAEVLSPGPGPGCRALIARPRRVTWAK